MKPSNCASTAAFWMSFSVAFSMDGHWWSHMSHGNFQPDVFPPKSLQKAHTTKDCGFHSHETAASLVHVSIFQIVSDGGVEKNHILPTQLLEKSERSSFNLSWKCWSCLNISWIPKNPRIAPEEPSQWQLLSSFGLLFARLVHWPWHNLHGKAAWKIHLTGWKMARLWWVLWYKGWFRLTLV